MSKEALAEVVERAIGDAAFRRELQADPAKALRGFSLGADESAALASGDAGRLSALGIDQRMSKLFTLGAAFSDNRLARVTDLTGGGPATLDRVQDSPDAAAHAVIPNDADVADDRLPDLFTSSVRAAEETGDGSVHDPYIAGDQQGVGDWDALDDPASQPVEYTGDQPTE